MPAPSPADPSEGVFYVVRLPDGWQLCTFRHDEYGTIGLPDCWVQVLEPFLEIWLNRFSQEGMETYETRHAALETALGSLVAGYDGFPRGEVRRGPGRKKYVIHHGGELSRTMRVSRKEIEDAFGIRGRTTWIEDPSHLSDRQSAERLRTLLPIGEKWEDA